MRGLIAAFLLSLPFHDDTRRIIEETFGDWALEAQEARDLPSRLVAETRGIFGITRALAGGLIIELAHVPSRWLLWRLLLITIVPVAIMFVDPLFSLRSVPWSTRVVLSVLLIPGALAVVLPLALFVTVAYPPPNRGVPGIGLAASGFALVLLLAGWIVPTANQQFRVGAYQQLADAPRGTLPPGPGEFTLSQLAARPSGQRSSPETAVLLFRSGLGPLTASLIVLGALVGTLHRHERRSWVMAVVITCILALSPLGGSMQWGAHAVWFVGLLSWLLTGFAICAATFLGWSQRRTRTLTLEH